jgi:hypothetical protein
VDLTSRHKPLQWRRLFIWFGYGMLFGVLVTAIWFFVSDHGHSADAMGLPNIVWATYAAGLSFLFLSPFWLASLAFWNVLMVNGLHPIEDSTPFRLIMLLVYSVVLPVPIFVCLGIVGGALGDSSPFPDRLQYTAYLSMCFAFVVLPRLVVPALNKSLVSKS